MLKKNYLTFFYPERFITVPYQVVTFLISAAFILYLAIRVLMFEFHPIEKYPHLLPISHELEEKWGTHVHVKTGMTILNFFSFDAIKNDFKFNVLLWFEYDPKKVDFKTIDKFLFTDAIVVSRSEPVFEDGPNGTKIVKYHIWLEFKAELLFRRFPIDDHVIYLTLTHDGINPSQLVYESSSDDFKLLNTIRTGGWTLAHYDVQTGYTKTQLSDNMVLEQPAAIFSLGVSKEDVRQTFLILLPLLFLFYLAIFSLSIINPISALNSAQAAVAGVLAYSFVMQTLSPEVGYFMISDYVFIILLASTFITYLMTMLSASLQHEHHLQQRTIDRIKGIIVILLYVVLLTSFYYLFMYKDLIHYDDWMHKKKIEVQQELPGV